MKKIIYMTLDELRGRRVVLKQDIKTKSGFKAKAGTKATLVGHYGRPQLRTDECPCCGGQLDVAFNGKKELAHYVELLPEEV